MLDTCCFYMQLVFRENPYMLYSIPFLAEKSSTYSCFGFGVPTWFCRLLKNVYIYIYMGLALKNLETRLLLEVEMVSRCLPQCRAA